MPPTNGGSIKLKSPPSPAPSMSADMARMKAIRVESKRINIPSPRIVIMNCAQRPELGEVPIVRVTVAQRWC